MDTQKIDWTQPLEAVHKDGRVAPVKLDPEYAAPGIGGIYTLDEEPAADSWYTWTADGKSWMDEEHDWTIRNVAPKEVEWGSEIKVEGKRPEWLGSYNGNLGYIRDGYDQYGPGAMWSERDIVAGRRGWETVTGIIFPANHPHYTTPTRTALEQRIEDLVRSVAGGLTSTKIVTEARAILAELEPVDPDLLEARRIVIKACRWFSTGDDQAKIVPNIEAGNWDNAGAGLVQDIVAALRGRALERGE